MDKSAIIETARRYAQVVAGELNPSTILLYGSYAQNTAHAGSDIDVAVIFDGFSGNWLETSARLWKLRRGISDDIEPILLDIKRDESGFIAGILRTGEVLYGS